MPIPQDLPPFPFDARPPQHPNCPCTIGLNLSASGPPLAQYERLMNWAAEFVAQEKAKRVGHIDWRDVEFVVWDALRKPPEGI